MCEAAVVRAYSVSLDLINTTRDKWQWDWAGNWSTIILFRSKLSHFECAIKNQIWHDIVDSYIIPPKHQVSRCSQDQDTNGWPKSRRAADVSAYLLSVHKFAGDFRTQNKFIEKSNEHFIDFVHFSTEGQLDACFPIIRHKVYLYYLIRASCLHWSFHCFSRGTVLLQTLLFLIFSTKPQNHCFRFCSWRWQLL